jgi:ribosomal protein S18 acetylase RimI-like enzyme
LAAISTNQANAMHQARIRRANVNDAPAIAKVHVAVSREIYATLVPSRALSAFTVDIRMRQWHDMIVSSDSDQYDAVYVADVDECGVVGFGCCSLQRSPQLIAKGFNGEFQSIYLMASARRRGLGRALMAEMARHLVRENIRGASCWVLLENDLARHFYEALRGNVIDEKVIELDKDIIRTELAYGWPDLNVLTGNDRSRRPLEDC